MGILDRFSLQGRVALVTAGAGPLFGSSISQALAEAGATVITASRSLEANERFAASLRAAGHDALGLQFDLSNSDSIRQLHDDVIARFGKLDVLVNSALARNGHGDRQRAEHDQEHHREDRRDAAAGPERSKRRSCCRRLMDSVSTLSPHQCCPSLPLC